MARITRRKLLELSGAGVQSRQRPAESRQFSPRAGAGLRTRARRSIGCAGTISFLRQTRYCAKQIAPECEKALGIKLNIETINGNDIQARTTSAIQSGSGPDVICALNNWPQLYAESVVDVSDLAEEIGKAQGGFYEESTASSPMTARNGSQCPGACSARRSPTANRGSTEIGYDDGKFPQTWEEYRDAGKKLKAKGHPIGSDARPHLRRRADLLPIRIFGPGAARRSRPTARPWCSTRKATVDSVKFMPWLLERRL